jgi:hypothetical protein
VLKTSLHKVPIFRKREAAGSGCSCRAESVADRLGYSIFLSTSSTDLSRYCGDFHTGIRYYDADLLSLLSHLIQDDFSRVALRQQEQHIVTPADELQAQVRSQHEEIQQLEQTITDLKYQLDLEHRYIMDSQARGLLSFLRRQPSSDLITKILEDPFFPPQASHWTYERILRDRNQATKEELEQFKVLWKLLLLETAHEE